MGYCSSYYYFGHGTNYALAQSCVCQNNNTEIHTPIFLLSCKSRREKSELLKLIDSVSLSPVPEKDAISPFHMRPSYCFYHSCFSFLCRCQTVNYNITFLSAAVLSNVFDINPDFEGC